MRSVPRLPARLFTALQTEPGKAGFLAYSSSGATSPPAGKGVCVRPMPDAGGWIVVEEWIPAELLEQG